MPKLVAQAKRIAKRLMKDVALGWLFPREYRAAQKAGVNPRSVVFLETKESVMPAAMKLAYERLLLDYDLEVEFLTLKGNAGSVPGYFRRCRQAVPKLAQARAIFLSDASDLVSALPIVPDTTVVQLWHGCGAFKKWGMSTADLMFGESREDQLAHPFYENLDLVTVSSPEVVWAYEEAMNLQGRGVVKPYGVSATDVYFRQGFAEEARRKLESALPGIAGRKIVLYAPTFRGRVRYAQAPDALDIERLGQAVGGTYALLLKHHPFVSQRPEVPASCADFAFDISERSDFTIEELLAAADVLVTDYSSIIFEYSLFGRPMAFFAYDRADYDDWRGFYYDYDEMTPGPVFDENDELVDWLAHCEERFDAQLVNDFCARFMSCCDGRATERIFDEAFDGALEEYRRVQARDVLVSGNPKGVDVSIVVPAHNAQGSLAQCLESLEAQSYDHARIELVVVDDGSTDETSVIVQGFARTSSLHVRLLRIDECSGSPAAPRNLGLEHARGTYVFFLDADDWLAPQAIERMLDAAVAWGSDMLLVKMVGEGGREVPRSMFGHSVPKADVYASKVMWSFAPLKLFRRSLVSDLRFPDFMPEDISFVLRAYCQAKVVSVLADADYYHVGAADSADHASVTTWDKVDSNLAAYRDVFCYIEDQVPAEKRDDVLMRRLFWRDIYRTLLSIADEPDDIAQAHFDELVALAKPHWREGMYKTCPADIRSVLSAAFDGGFGQLKELV